jgi:hypothetical protein
MIQQVVYLNEKGDKIVVDFADPNVDYRSDRMEDLRREMVSGDKLGPDPKGVDWEKAKRMGPPPREEKPEGGQAAWGEGVFEF